MPPDKSTLFQETLGEPTSESAKAACFSSLEKALCWLVRKDYSANEIRTDLRKCCATLVDKNI